MKAILLSAVIALFWLTQVNRAHACSYYIDEAKKAAELKAVAVGSLFEATVLSSAVTKFSFFESKPTPMCPKELTYNALVTVSYKHGFNTCIAELSVKKVESWGDSDQDVYTVSGRRSARCKK